MQSRCTIPVTCGAVHAVEICSMETDGNSQKREQVAVKRLKPMSGIGINDLASEARILARLHHR